MGITCGKNNFSEFCRKEEGERGIDGTGPDF
jgi:hypothetical protein